MDAGRGRRDDRAAATVKHDEQFFAFYAGACKALGPETPVCLQDYPAVTGAYMSVPVFSQIVRDLPQVVMLKAEDQPGLTKISRIRALEAQGQRRVSILVGNNGLFYPLELARGADGAMTGVAYPEMLTEVYQAMQRRRTATWPTTCSRSTCRWCATKRRPACRWPGARRSCAGAAPSPAPRCDRPGRS
jgi:hypothetical protein